MKNFIYTMTIIFSFIGLISIFFNNYSIVCFSAILIIIEHIIGRIEGSLKSFFTLITTIFIGIVVSIIFETNIINSISCCLCIYYCLIILFGLLYYNETYIRYKNLNCFSDKINFFINELLRVSYSIESTFKSYDLIKTLQLNYNMNTLKQNVNYLYTELNTLCIIRNELILKLPKKAKEIFGHFEKRANDIIDICTIICTNFKNNNSIDKDIIEKLGKNIQSLEKILEQYSSDLDNNKFMETIL